MFKSLRYQNREGTMILATREDGSMVLVEPSSRDLFDAMQGGVFGEIGPFVAPPERPERPKADPMCDMFRLAMIAAQAVADGVTDPTNDEIKEMLRAAK